MRKIMFERFYLCCPQFLRGTHTHRQTSAELIAETMLSLSNRFSMKLCFCWSKQSTGSLTASCRFQQRKPRPTYLIYCCHLSSFFFQLSFQLSFSCPKLSCPEFMISFLNLLILVNLFEIRIIIQSNALGLFSPFEVVFSGFIQLTILYHLKRKII